MQIWTLVATASILPALPAQYSTGACVYPEICKPPITKFAKVAPIRPRMQWSTNGGFCGALSMQVMAMSYGAWISQDLVRKANRGGPCYGHTSDDASNGTSGELGCEVGPENYARTARGLKLAYDEWDYRQARPQASAWKKWMKSHLAKGEPVMWVPMEKGNSHTPYGPRSCPGGGHFDHHEPIIGIGSNFDLSDQYVHDDDWIVHFSDYSLQPCYRRISSLEDAFDMNGNCRDADKDKKQMFPCFYKEVTYGMSIVGLKLNIPTLRVFLEVDKPYEPNVRLGEQPLLLQGTVRVHGLRPGARYVLYRFDTTEALPSTELSRGFEHRIVFVPDGETWTFTDPNRFLSNSAIYYVAVPDGDFAISGFDLDAEPVSANSFWLFTAPTWPAIVKAKMSSFMGSSDYEGGSRHESLFASAQQSRLAKVATLAICVAIAFTVASTGIVLWSWRSRGVQLGQPALG